MNKPRIPLDYAKSQGRKPRAERRGNDDTGCLACACLFSAAGWVAGAIVMYLYMTLGGGC